MYKRQHYNYVRFSFQNIEEWIHSLSDIMIDLDGDNGNDQKIGVSRKSSELVTIDGLGDLQIKAIANCHDFVLKLQKPLLTEKIVSLVGNIRNIIQLGINSLILIDSIAVKLSSVSDYDTFLYFSPAEQEMWKSKQNTFRIDLISCLLTKILVA